MSKGSEVLELLRQGWSKPAIMAKLGASDSYVRSIASTNRISIGHRVYHIEDQGDAEENPIKIDHSNRAATLLSAGLSPYEVRQLLPSWSGVYV